MIVVKAFGPGLKCRGYQYHEGLNVCEQAKCVRDGFHAAEDPLDCLDYYHSFEGNEFWLCEAGGDIDEDGSDSKISCTELRLLYRLDLTLFVAMALRYMAQHPNRRRNVRVKWQHGETDANHFVIVEGDGTHDRLTARGRAVGDVIGFHDMWSGKVIAFYVDGQTIKPGKWYDINGEEVPV